MKGNMKTMFLIGLLALGGCATGPDGESSGDDRVLNEIRIARSQEEHDIQAARYQEQFDAQQAQTREQDREMLQRLQDNNDALREQQIEQNARVGIQ